MKRRRLPRALLQALLAAGVGGCAAAPTAVNEVGARVLPLPPPPADAALLALHVTPGPDAAAAVWRVLLVLGTGADDRVPLGQVALHPPGQPGRFLLRVPPAALHRARGAPGGVALMLDPVPAGTPATEDRWQARAEWLPEPQR